MMNQTIQEMRQAYIDAETRQRAAYRRAVWLEQRLYEARTEEEYSAISAELEQWEKKLQELSAIAMTARYAYTAASFAI